MIAPVFSRSSRAELETLIGAVTRDHRLTTQTLPYRKLAQLRRAGVLVSTNRGIYAVAPECEIAFGALAHGFLLGHRRIARAEQSIPAEGDTEDAGDEEAAE